MPLPSPARLAPVLAAASVLGLPAEAAAAPFGAPQPTGLPTGGQTVLALADDGGASVAVRSFEGEGESFRIRLQVAAGTLAGGLGPAETLLLARGGSVRELQVARSGGGGSVVAWAQDDPGPGGAQRLRYAAREAGARAETGAGAETDAQTGAGAETDAQTGAGAETGAGAAGFGAPRTLARVASVTGSQLRVAGGPDGTVLAVWRDRGRLLAATARRGRFGAARVLTADGVFPSVASTGAGRWVVAWARGPQRRRVGVVAELRGRRIARREVGPIIASAFVPGLRVTGAPDGTAFVTGLRRIAGERYRGRAFLRQVAPAPGREERLGDARRTRLPSVAAGPGGQAVLAFLGIPEGARFAALLGAVRPAGGPLPSVGVVSREEVYEVPRVAWAAGGPLVGWISQRRAGPVVRVTVPGGAERAPAATLGPAGAPQGLQLAGSRAGALAVWPGTEGRLVTAAAPAG